MIGAPRHDGLWDLAVPCKEPCTAKVGSVFARKATSERLEKVSTYTLHGLFKVTVCFPIVDKAWSLGMFLWVWKASPRSSLSVEPFISNCDSDRVYSKSLFYFIMTYHGLFCPMLSIYVHSCFVEWQQHWRSSSSQLAYGLLFCRSAVYLLKHHNL